MNLKDLEKDIDFSVGDLKTFPMFEACLYGKHSRKKFPVSQANKASQLLKLIHFNLVWPLANSLRVLRYFITFNDDLSRFTSIAFLNVK